MKSYRIHVFALVFSVTASARGGVPFDFYTAVKGDSVFIVTTRTLRAGENLLVERKGPADADFRLLTETPIEADMNPFALGQLGSMYPVIADAVQANDPQSALLALRTDDFYGMVFTLLDRRVAALLGRWFAAPGNRSGVTYTYKLTLRERDGTILETVTHAVTIQETPPAVSPRLSGEQAGNRIHLSWKYPDWSGDRSDLAIRFRLERKGPTGDFTPVQNKILPRIGADFYHYYDDAVRQGGTYTYRIQTVDVAGLSGPWSNGVSVAFNDILPPSKPTGITAEAAGTSVRLSWQPNPEPDLSHYDVYRMELEKADSIRINPAPIPSGETVFTDAGIVYRHTYYYTIVAVDSAGNESQPSEVVHALATDTTPPDPPSGLTAVVKDRAVTLSWRPVADSDLSGYRVSRSMNDETFFPIHEGCITDTTCFDSGPEGKTLEPGRHYYYAVKAVDSLDHSSEAAGIWVVVPDDDPPLPPGQVVAENQHGRRLIVSWSPSPSRDVDRYRVVRLAGESERELGVLSGDTRVFQDDSVSLGETVLYGVTAVDTAGNESERKWSYPEARRDFDPPPATRFIEAAWIDSAVTVQWDPVGAADLAGYNVYRSGLPTGVGEKLNSTPLQATVFTDAAGTAGQWYWVTSVDNSGNESAKSVPVAARGGQ
ncbi:hypothetical protein JXO52_05255 [bacterium]|nr:hypothetical protein [bacterium]